MSAQVYRIADDIPFKVFRKSKQNPTATNKAELQSPHNPSLLKSDHLSCRS